MAMVVVTVGDRCVTVDPAMFELVGFIEGAPGAILLPTGAYIIELLGLVIIV